MAVEADLLDVVDKIYAASLDEGGWAPALDAMADLLGAVGVSFEIIDKKIGRPIMIELGDRLEQVDSAEYLDYYGAISPRVIRADDLSARGVSYDHLILTESQMDADEFYRDCLAPQGLRYFVAGHVLSNQNHAGVFAAQRSFTQGHVGEIEISLVRRLLPHMRQALDLKFRLQEARLQNESLLDTLEGLGEAAIIVDRAGVVLHANRAAAEIFSMADGVTVAHGRLYIPNGNGGGRLDSALNNLTMAEGDAVDLDARNFAAHRPSGKRPYLVAVRPLPARAAAAAQMLQPAAIIFIRDPDSFVRLDADLVRQSYHLTVAETEIACALDNGLSLREVADQRGVAISTVRGQVYGLMAKLSVNRQTDLIRLLRHYRRSF